MNTFLGYAIPGIPFGCTYAIVAIGLVLTYQTTGVFNFGFGAQAFASAFVYTVLVGRGIGTGISFVIAVLVLAPMLGVALDRLLFRHIASSNTVAKIVSSVGVLVAIPELLSLIFGNQTRFAPPQLFLNQASVYFHLGSTPINGLELETVIMSVAIVGIVIAILHSRGIGLEMRAAVESRRMLELHGVPANRVVGFAWVLSSTMAGLAGVLLAPQYPTLQANDFAILLVAAIAAAAVGSLRSVPLALAGGILLGVIGGLGAGYFPPSSIWHTGLLPGIPFLLLAVLLVAAPRLRNLETSNDPLASSDPPPPPPITVTRAPELDRLIKGGGRVLAVVAVVSVLTWVPANWVFVLTTGLVFSVVFLSITLITGMGGQLSLCQASFAGVGAFTAGQLALHFGMPVLLGIVVGTVVAGIIGAVAALPALRLRGLPLALLTLAFALLADNVAFPASWIGGPLTGLNVPRPQVGSLSFATESTRAFFVLALVVLILCALVVRFVQRGTIGSYLAAMRGSPAGAAAIGVNLNSTKVLVFSLSACLAGLGGGLYASLQQTVTPADFNYEFSLVFVVVVVTTGVRTIEGAIQAGLGFVVVQQLLSYLPGRFGAGGLAIVLFAFGALTYASHPEGVVEYQKRQWTQRAERILLRRAPRGTPPAMSIAGGAVPTIHHSLQPSARDRVESG